MAEENFDRLVGVLIDELGAVASSRLDGAEFLRVLLHPLGGRHAELRGNERQFLRTDQDPEFLFAALGAEQDQRNRGDVDRAVLQRRKRAAATTEAVICTSPSFSPAFSITSTPIISPSDSDT